MAQKLLSSPLFLCPSSSSSTFSSSLPSPFSLFFLLSFPFLLSPQTLFLSRIFFLLSLLWFHFRSPAKSPFLCSHPLSIKQILGHFLSSTVS